jgi:hypothetical protein
MQYMMLTTQDQANKATCLHIACQQGHLGSITMMMTKAKQLKGAFSKLNDPVKADIQEYLITIKDKLERSPYYIICFNKIRSHSKKAKPDLRLQVLKIFFEACSDPTILI